MTDPLTIGLDQRSVALRKTIIRTLEAGQRGHVGAAFSLVEILRVLYDDVLKYDSRRPKWAERDRFVLSKGHGCLALYAILADKGFFPEAELSTFCKSNGLLGGHPEHHIPGVEASTGSLGHGMSLALGMALNGRLDRAAYRTFVVIGDGESNEGSIWEAALSAGKHRLSRFIVLTDYNKHQSYGSTAEVQNLEPLADKWRAFGFAAVDVNGHDPVALREVLSRVPLDPDKPTAVVCHTVKGKGIPFAENDMAWHHQNKVTAADAERLLTALEAPRHAQNACRGPRLEGGS
jgi:transketolase